jgi:chromosome segregation ATPase
MPAFCRLALQWQKAMPDKLDGWVGIVTLAGAVFWVLVNSSLHPIDMRLRAVESAQAELKTAQAELKSDMKTAQAELKSDLKELRAELSAEIKAVVAAVGALSDKVGSVQVDLAALGARRSK